MGNLISQIKKQKFFGLSQKNGNFVKIAKTKIKVNYFPIVMNYRLINYDKSKNISHLEIKLITGKLTKFVPFNF